MKGIDAKHSVKRFTCPRQTFSGPLRESGARRLGFRMRQHLSRGVQTRHGNPAAADEPKPMAGAAANLEDTLVEGLADERKQRGLDAGVIVLLVSSVVRFGDVVIV